MDFFSQSSISSSDHLKLVNVKATSRETTLCLAGAHALVRLDDGTVVGDPMEKATLEALEWQIGNGDGVAPAAPSAPHRTVVLIRRRFQFSSALKRMSTVSTLPGGRGLVAVKGAPETLKTMLAQVPSDYDETYKWYTRRGSRVLALGMKEYDSISMDRVRTAVKRLNKYQQFYQIKKLNRDEVESHLKFAGFLIFHSPLKPDAIDALKMLADSSHRVRYSNNNYG